MRIEGKLIKRTYTISSTVVGSNDANDSFTDSLEKCLVQLCREFHIPVPLWLNKNTREFARFRRTFFFSEQFDEDVGFDRFEIRQIRD